MVSGSKLTIGVGNTEWDAKLQWGISLDSSALSALIAPAPLKDMIENKSALENGKRVFSSGRKWDERTLTLGFNIVASSEQDFWTKYASFCSQVLSAGRFYIETCYQSGVAYFLDYLSCQTFGEFSRTMGKFVLRVIETNPANRTAPTVGNGNSGA